MSSYCMKGYFNEKMCTVMYNKRCHVHWYVGEGIEEGQFQEALDNVKSLANEYKNMEKYYNDNNEESENNVLTDRNNEM